MKKFISSVIVSIFALFCFVGCESVDRKVEKASKSLSNYEIDAVYSEETKTISATETVKYINKTDQALNNVCFHIYGTAFSKDATIKPYALSSTVKCFPNGINSGDTIILDVKENENKSNFEIVGEDNNILKVNLTSSLNIGEIVEIVITFETILANCTHRLGYFNNSVNLGNWYPIACVFENGEFDMTPYYSNGDPFFSNCSNYKIKFQFPSVYNCLSTGNIVSENIDNNITTKIYEAKAVRDFALHLSKETQIITSKIGETEISVVCDIDDVNCGEYLATAEKSLELFNDKFGKYPYKTLNVCFTEFLHGGMEYPNIVYISNSVDEMVEIKKIIIHEIAHQWWYGIVGNNEIKDSWIDESLAEYSTLVYFENYNEDEVSRESMIENAKSNYLLYVDVIKTLNLNLNESMQSPIYDYVNEYEYVYMIYIKGLIFLDELRNTIGDVAFFKGIKLLYEKNMFNNISKREFIDAFEKSSNLELDNFMEEWLSGKVTIN